VYAKGQGVAPDYVEAHKWLSLAATNGYNAVGKSREIIERKMTRTQIAEAQRRASEWLKTHGK